MISLIGYRATGKTTVAALLAERLGWPCSDTDAEIQQQSGKSIREIFENDGEATFRDLESHVIQEFARRHKWVLSLGGGAVLREENRSAIRVAGPVVWLSASVSTIRHRLENDAQTLHQRPSLTGRDPFDEIQEVLMVRTPIYQEIADLTVDTDALTPRQIADQLIRDLDLSATM